MEEYRALDSRVIILKRENRGVSVTRNAGMDIVICEHKRVDARELFYELPDNLDESSIKTVSMLEIINMTYWETFD